MAGEKQSIMGFALLGAPKLESRKSRFAPYRERFSAEYAAGVFKVGGVYKEAVKVAFQRTHGRTGRTSRSVEGKFHPGVVMWGPQELGIASTYDVQMEGAISYVINPIPTHDIPSNWAFPTRNGREGLSNWGTNQMAREREINYYSEFGARTVTWMQGISSESYSPDRSWYQQGEVRRVLDAQGIDLLHHLAADAVNLWGEEMVGEVVLAEG